jgi:hypothetical protein
MALRGKPYLGAMLVLIALVAAAISIVWLEIAILMAAFLWLVLKALWVGLAPPGGTEITARDAPPRFVFGPRTSTWTRKCTGFRSRSGAIAPNPSSPCRRGIGVRNFGECADRARGRSSAMERGTTFSYSRSFASQ